MKTNKDYIIINLNGGTLKIPYDVFKRDVGYFLAGPYDKIQDFLIKNNY